MPGPLPASLRSKIIRLLLLQWRPDTIAEEVHCCTATVYSMQESLFIYGSAYRPQFRPKGAPRKISKAAEDSLMHYLSEQPWALQKELVWFLWEEWDIHINQSTVSRLLKRRWQSEAIQILYWLAENQHWGPHTHCRWAMLALLPIAATEGRGQPRKPPPSKRQDSWGVIAG